MEERSNVEVWRSLDEGEDPTADTDTAEGDGRPKAAD